MSRSLVRSIILIPAASTAVAGKSTGSDPELAAIRATAEAHLSANPDRLRNVFLPGMNLFTTESWALYTMPMPPPRRSRIR